MKEINELERSKIYAIKKLDEEMDFKVKETSLNFSQIKTAAVSLMNHR